MRTRTGLQSPIVMFMYFIYGIEMTLKKTWIIGDFAQFFAKYFNSFFVYQQHEI